MAPRGGGAKLGGALPKLRILCPKAAFFGPKRPRKPVITAKRRQTVPTLHVRLDCPVNKRPFSPSSSMLCPKKWPKNGQKRPKCALLVSNTAKTKNGPYLGLRGSKPSSVGSYSTRNPPTFCGFQASESPNETPTPWCQWSLRVAGGQHTPRTVWGQRWVLWGPRGEQNHFFQRCSSTTWDARTRFFSPF